MVRTNQGGSVLSFIVIGVVAVSLLVGGVYYVRQQIDSAVAEPSQPAPQQPEEAQPEKPAEKSPEAPAEESRDQPSQRQEAAPPPSANSDTSDDAELPQTGPAEFLATLLALGLLSATAVSYLRSRRPELSL